MGKYVTFCRGTSSDVGNDRFGMIDTYLTSIFVLQSKINIFLSNWNLLKYKFLLAISLCITSLLFNLNYEKAGYTCYFNERVFLAISLIN